MRGKRWLIGGVVTAVAVGVAAAVVVGRDRPKGGAAEQAPATLAFAPHEVVHPARMALPVSVRFSGPLVAPDTAVVRAKAPGTLLALDVAEGQRVRAGQALGRLDLAELAARVAERGAMLEAARAALAQAERQHASNEKLAGDQFISAQALETSRAALETARAQWRAAQAQLDTAQVGWRHAALVAPIGGIVAKRHAVPGEKLTPEQPLLTIVNLSRLELAGHVGTHEVSRLAAGMPVTLQVEGVDAPVAGRVARIAPAAEPGSRSIGVAVTLDNPGERLRAGQYALARVTLDDSSPVLTVPATALGTTSGQDHVWLIEDGKLLRRVVTVGRRDGVSGRVEVLQGLDESARVLAGRYDNLREGALASVAATVAPVASAASAALPATTQ